MTEARHRLFFALWPDEEAAGHLEALAHALAPRGAKPVRGHNLHLTLAFLGTVDDAGLGQALAAADRVDAESFAMSLDRLGFWPRGGVLYAGSRQPATGYRCLMQALSKELLAGGFTMDPRPPVPHVTLARRVRGLDLPRLETPITWSASEFALVKSRLHPTAASYETLATWPLNADGIN